MTSNYFVEIKPGKKLEGIINTKKAELIDFFGMPLVDDPFKVGYLRDPPHFTLIGGRTSDLYEVASGVRELRKKFSRINYEIVGVEDNPVPGNMIEMRTVVKKEDRQKFKDLHLEIIEIAKEFNPIEIYEKWDGAFAGEALENIKYCGFPLARNLYKPHASIGRVHKDLRSSIDHLMDESVFDPRGKFTSGDLVVWILPFEKDDPRAIPQHYMTIPLE
jgi:hypothetical protein